MKLTNYHFKLGVYAISHNIVKAKCTDIQQFNSVKFKVFYDFLISSI